MQPYAPRPTVPAVAPEMLAFLQQVAGMLGNVPLPSAALRPFQYPALPHLDARYEQEVQRAAAVDGLSSKTIMAYRTSYRYFRRYLVATPDAECAFLGGQLTEQQRVLEGWIGYLRTGRANHTTVNSYWRGLHATFARIARADGIVDPTQYVPTPKPGKSMADFLTREELEKVFRFARNYQWPGGEFERTRNVAMVAVMALGGCRLSEVLKMQVEDVDCTRATIRIKRGKGQRGGKPRVVCMAPALVAAMLAYLDERAGRELTTNRVFVSTVVDRPLCDMAVRRVFSLIRQALGRRVAPHILRHTCATLMRQEGVTDRLSMDQLGHSSLAVLQRYSHVAPTERQAVIAQFALNITDDEPTDLQTDDRAGITGPPRTFTGPVGSTQP